MNSSAHPKLAQLALLQEAIASSLSGDKQSARAMLEQVTAAHPENELAWLWLASVSLTPQETIRCWRRVHKINPHQEQALGGLKQLLLQEGIQAAQDNRIEEGRALLLELTQLDALNEVAWLWLANLATDVEEAARYTACVLQINPQHERAQAWMEKLRPPNDARLKAPVESCLERRGETAAAAEMAVTTATDTTSPRAGTAALPRPEASGAYTILIVDDSPTIRKLVTMTLEKYGHQVFSATNGLDALTKLKEVVPDLILSDINMPHMDGYQLCKMIRGNSVTRSVPVIMLSGKDGIFDKLRGRMVGATAYITKPFEIDSLLQLIDMHCQQAQEV